VLRDAREAIISVFGQDGVVADVNAWQPEPMGHRVLMPHPEAAANRAKQSIVSTIDAFTRNFNLKQPNMLHRLGDIFKEEPIIAAGGSVLQALTTECRLGTFYTYVQAGTRLPSSHIRVMRGQITYHRIVRDKVCTFRWH
jgi:hypothetical protein